MSIEDEIKKIRKRNKKVEMDKAWETSKTRKTLVAVLTYSVIVLVMYVLKLDSPFISAIIPTFGFLLSTLSVGFAKSIWIRFVYS